MSYYAIIFYYNFNDIPNLAVYFVVVIRNFTFIYCNLILIYAQFLLPLFSNDVYVNASHFIVNIYVY